MFRNIFVALIILAGLAYSLQGPFYAVLLYLWVAYFRPDAWLWSNWVTTINLSLLVGLLAVFLTVLFAGQARWRFNLAVALLALFFLQSLGSTMMSPYPQRAWFWWKEFAKVLLIGYLIIVHTTDEKRLRTVLVVIALSLGFEGAKQGWAQFILNPGAANINTHPALGDNNGVAVAMFMLVPVLAALGASTNRWAWRAVFWFLTVGVVFRGITTYSRGGFLSAAALVVVSLIRGKHRVRLLAAIVLVSALILPVMPQQFWDRMQTITTADEAPDESAAGRLYFWQVAISMARARPMAGVGFNAYSPAYNDFEWSGGAYGPDRAVHSVWLGLLSELGIPGLTIFVALIFVAFASCHRVRRRTRTHAAQTPLMAYAAALETSFVVFIVGGTFLNIQYSEMVWHFLCVAITLGEVAGSGDGTSAADHAATGAHTAPAAVSA